MIIDALLIASFRRLPSVVPSYRRSLIPRNLLSRRETDLSLLAKLTAGDGTKRDDGGTKQQRCNETVLHEYSSPAARPAPD